MSRQLFVLVHRWVGLTIAAFLCVSGITGAVISWDHELDELLNSRLTHVDSRGVPLPSLDLAARIEAADARVIVTYVPLAAEEGKAFVFGVAPKQDPATGRLYDVGYNEVFIDPVTGKELGRREWGAPWPVTRENFVSFLYVLHYSLHVPAMWGIDRWGLWLLGVVAVLWTLDCFVGFYLTLPPGRRAARDRRNENGDDDGAQDKSWGRKSWEGKSGEGKSWWGRWSRAWKVRWRAGSTKLNFDVHRAFSLWTWALLFVIAFTGFSLNLYSEVFFPLMSKVSSVSPSPFDLREPNPIDEPVQPNVSFADVLARATAEARERGWHEPAGGLSYAPDYGIYSVSFFEPGNDHGTGGVGNRTLYHDAADGRALGEYLPFTGTGADIFVQVQFPLHSGRILGVPGRILISLMGLVVAILSVTGVVIWARKRTYRVNRAARRPVWGEQPSAEMH
jgi:uncharacterized iron-regulated membrane protein